MSHIVNERYIEDARERFDSATTVAERERVIEELNECGFTRQACQLAEELSSEWEKMEDIKNDEV